MEWLAIVESLRRSEGRIGGQSRVKVSLSGKMPIRGPDNIDRAPQGGWVWVVLFSAHVDS